MPQTWKPPCIAAWTFARETMRLHHAQFVTLLIILPASLPGHAEVYKWIGEGGKVHYADKPPPGAGGDRIGARIQSLAGPPTTDTVESALAAPGRIVMYTTQWCGYCRRAREHLRQRGIPFDDRDIERSAGARREFDRLGGKGVPVIVAGEHRMNGYTASALDGLLEKAGLTPAR